MEEGIYPIKYTNPDTEKEENIIVLDLAYMPTGWTVDDFISFVKEKKIAVIDSFNKGK